MLLTAAAEKARRARKREIVSLTEIIVLQRILQGKVAVETVCFGLAVIRADDRVHLSLPPSALHHNHLQLEGILLLPGCSFSFIFVHWDENNQVTGIK